MSPEHRYDTLITYYCEKYGLDPRQIKRQIRKESSFDPRAKSPVGATGLMQFMPSTWADLRGGVLPAEMYNPEINIETGCKYMCMLLNQFKGKLDKALAAYNWGSGNIKKLDNITDWLDKCPTETRLYVINCMQYEEEVLA